MFRHINNRWHIVKKLPWIQKQNEWGWFTKIKCYQAMGVGVGAFMIDKTGRDKPMFYLDAYTILSISTLSE